MRLQAVQGLTTGSVVQSHSHTGKPLMCQWVKSECVCLTHALCALQWNLGRRDKQWQPLRSHPEQEMPDRGQHDVSGSQPPAPAALQLSQIDSQEAACSSEPEDQVQHQADTVLVVGSGERQPLMGSDDQDAQGLDTADLASASVLGDRAEDPAPTAQHPVMQLRRTPKPPGAEAAGEREPGLLECASAAPERVSFGRAESAPSATVDAAADAALAVAQTGSALRVSEQSEDDCADSSVLEAGAVSRAADLARRPSQPLEAGLGHDRLAIRTSVPTVAHDGASSSRGDAAGASSSAAAGDDSPVMRCVWLAPQYL